ncbi:MAG: hypothetical protein H0W97_12340, partial [Actinobacteria bacterium]|nr:hypothetical protein [Actinomycetota bacterium]
MRKAMRFGLAGLMTAALLGGTSTAFANDDAVIREGPCSMQSDWKIK